MGSLHCFRLPLHGPETKPSRGQQGILYNNLHGANVHKKLVGCYLVLTFRFGQSISFST